MPTSASNEKLFWADRKNRMEKSRLDMLLKNMDREQMYLTHDIDREKRAVVKDLTLVRRTSGVSDQGVPPRDENDTGYQSAPNYRMGLRLSERRLLEWRENEKQMEKFMHHSAWELAKASGKHMRHSEDHKLPKRAQSAKHYNYSTSSVGGYTEVKVLDDDVFMNGQQASESLLNLDPLELEKQIFQQYKDSIHQTRIPSTSDVMKLKATRQVRSDSDLGNEEKKRLRFRPHTASFTSQTKRKTSRGIPKRPATAFSKAQADEKQTITLENETIPKPTKLLVDNFMTMSSPLREQLHEDIPSNDIMDTSEHAHNDNMSECESDIGSSTSNPSPRTISDRMRALMPEVEDKLKGTYINSSITIIYDEGDDPYNKDGDEQQGSERSNGETLIELRNSENLNPNDVDGTDVNENKSVDDTESEEVEQTFSEIIKTNTGPKADPENSQDKLTGHLSSDMVNGRFPKQQRLTGRVLTGIAEDKVLTIDEQELNNTNPTQNTDMLSTTLSSSSRLTSRQRRPSSTSSLSQSDRLSGMYSSMSDIYSIGSDGQRRPSKWRQYVAADTAPVPQKKMVTVTAVVKAALAFSKMARKRALNKLVEEQSTDPVELIRQERLRRLHSRNNILQTITNSWSMKGDTNIAEVKEQV